MPTCLECGRSFEGAAQARTCSDECRRNRKARYDHERYTANKDAFRAYHRQHARKTRARKREYDRAYREANREQRLARKREYGREYYQRPDVKIRARLYAHKRRDWAGGRTIAVRDVERLMRRYDHLCGYCGSSPADALDHVVPLSRGGSHSIGNLVPSCRSCNSTKSHRTVMEWRLGKVVPRAVSGGT